MRTNAYSIYDSKSGAFGAPFFMQATGLAIRAFTDLVNDSKSTLFKYPSDFDLYHVGHFDDSEGKLIALTPVVNLGNASAFVVKVKEV